MIANYEQALKLNPEIAVALNSLARHLAIMPVADRRDGKRAVQFAARALALNDRESGFFDSTATAYAEAGRFANAVRAQKTGIEILRLVNRMPATVIEDFESRLQLYKSNRPFYRSQ